MEPLNLASLPKYLSDEGEAWALLERLRWPDNAPVCPHCGVKDERHYFLKARSGERRTAKGTITYRRIWKCRDKDCRQQFSVLVGTVFESSKVPVAKWLLALYLMSAGKNSVSALEFERHLGVSHQTAWFLAHRLREAMKREPLAGLLSGVVVSDETFVGGKPKNKHQQGRVWGRPGGGTAHLSPVLALVHKETGEVRARAVTRVTGANLRAAMTGDLDVANTVLHTDAAGHYKAIAPEFAGHERVDHSAHEYVREDGVSTNLAESFFAQFKRSLDGTFHHVSPAHLDRYVQEFAFRWNTRKLSDHARVERLIEGALGRRLTYRPATEP